MTLPECIRPWRRKIKLIKAPGLLGFIGKKIEVDTLIPDTPIEDETAILTIYSAKLNGHGCYGLSTEAARRVKMVDGNSGLKEFQGETKDINELARSVLGTY